MKKLLTLLIFVASFTAKGQYQTIFGSNQTNWNTYFIAVDFNGTDSAIVYNDTIINLLTYKKVALYETYTPYFMYNFYLREDTTTGKVWFWSDNLVDSTEKLVIDMSLVLGDTFNLFDNNLNAYTPIVVDSVYYLSGRKHIRFNYFANWNSMKTEMIEGIGRNTGMSKFALIENYFATYLLCAQKNFTYTFQHQLGPVLGFTECSYTYIGIKENNFNNLKIYPNPAQNEITVQLDSKSRFDYTIINVSGQIINSGTSINKNVIVANIPNGYYFFQIKQGEKHFSAPLVISR